MPFLLVITGPNLGDYHVLGDATVMVGREESCEIQILDERVSRHHLAIRFNPTTETYAAADQNSANGVQVNDAPISAETQLADGDIIGLGDSELIFSDRDFIDRDTSLEHYKRRIGERYKRTLS